MSQDSKENIHKDLYLETEENESKILNYSLTPETIRKEGANEAITREQEINYSLSKLIKNLRLESNEISSLKVENGTSFDKHCSPEIIESANSLFPFKGDEKLESTDSLIKSEMNEIRFSLSDQLKKLNIGSDVLFPSKIEKAVHKYEVNSNTHWSDKRLNNSFPLEEKVLEEHDSNAATEKEYKSVAILKFEINVEQTCLPNEKCISNNYICAQSTSEKENHAPFENKYSNKIKILAKASKNNFASCENKDNSETTDNKVEKSGVEENKIELSSSEKESELEELVKELNVHETRGRNSGSQRKEKETSGIKMYERDCCVELKNCRSLKEVNNKRIDHCYIIENTEIDGNDESNSENGQSRNFICNCNLDVKTKVKDTDEDIKNSDEVSILVKKYDEKDYDNNKENISEKCNENKGIIKEEFNENLEKADEESDKVKESVIEDSNGYVNNVIEYFVEEKENVIEEYDENKEKVTEESDTREEKNIENSNENKNNVYKYFLEEQETVIEEFDENQEKLDKESDENQEKLDEESDENQEIADEEYDENQEDIEDSNEYKNNVNNYFVEEEEDVNEESDEDQETDTEEFGDQIRTRGPMKTVFKTHSKKPYPTKGEARNSYAVASSVSSQRPERSPLSSETDYSNASYSDSGFSSSPSTSHSYDDLEENQNEETANDELSEVHDEIAEFLQSIQTPEYLGLVESLFGELSLENYSITHASCENNLRERNILASEILENVFGSETSTKDFSKRVTSECRIHANSNLSFNDNSYNESLLEMFDNEAILQTVEANVNSRTNLLPNRCNLDSLEVRAFTAVSPAHTLPISQIENSNSKELPVESNTAGVEILSNFNADETNSECLPNFNERSSRSSSNAFETPLQNPPKENFCSSSNLNSRKKSAVPNKTRKKRDSPKGTVSKQESSQIPLKCKEANGFSKQILRSILHNERLLLSLWKYYKRIQKTKDGVIYVTELRGSKGKHLNLTNLHVAVINSDLEEIYAIVEIHKQYNKTFADINRKDVFGKTVLDYAIEKENQIVIDYLIENTAQRSIVIGKKT